MNQQKRQCRCVVDELMSIATAVRHWKSSALMLASYICVDLRDCGKGIPHVFQITDGHLLRNESAKK